jgi:hypothetical protein
MTYLSFSGLLTLGNPSRCGGDPDGAILVGGKDVVDEVLEEKWGPDVAIFLNGDEIARGAVTGAFGDGYSEYTPTDNDELSFGGVDVLSLLEARDGQLVTIVVTDRPDEFPTADAEGGAE